MGFRIRASTRFGMELRTGYEMGIPGCGTPATTEPPPLSRSPFAVHVEARRAERTEAHGVSHGWVIE